MTNQHILCAEYVGELAGELAKLASLAGLNHLAYLLDMATVEAATVVGKESLTVQVVQTVQGGDCGAVYAADEVAALSHAAKKHDVHVHMDGARFANAVASLGCAPADITWRAGVDILSFGATKNGGLGADAVIIFDPAGAGAEWLHRAREACDWFGYLASKSRFVAAQLDAMLADGHWLDLARRANAMAERLAVGLEAVPGVRLAFPRQINEVFAVLPRAVDAAMRAKGARYHPWTTKSSAPDRAPRDGEGLFRFVASFETNAESVDALLAAASSATSAEAAE